MYNFGDLELKVPKKISNALNHLKNIIDEINVERKPYHDIPATNAYLVTIKKDFFSKQFYMHITKYNKEILVLEINNRRVDTETKIELALLSIEDEIYVNQNPQMKNIMNMIRCENHKCPICESKVEIVNQGKHLQTIMCPNKCYTTKSIKNIENENNLLTFVYFFGKKEINTYKTTNYNSILTAPIKESEIKNQLEKRIQLINDICENINYWKTNERYLSRILGGI